MAYYQPPPPFTPPRPPSTNGLAIASLVLGIVCCVPPLGLILGLTALSQIKRRGQRGTGMAVTGVILSGVSTLLVVIAFASGKVGEAWDGFQDGVEEAARSTSTLDLREGDCFNAPGTELAEEAASVEVVDCAAAHDGEVTGVFTLDQFDEWPGEAAIEPIAGERCLEINEQYATETSLPDNATTYYYMPSGRSWRILDDRTVTCTYAAVDGKLTGSVRSAGAEESANAGA